MKSWRSATLLVLQLQLPLLALSSIEPGAISSPSAMAQPVDVASAQNAVIAANVAAAIAQGQPTKMLITFKVSDQEVATRAHAIMQAAAITGPAPVEVVSLARRQVYKAVKSRVLGSSAARSSSSVVKEAATVSQQQQPAPAAGAVQVAVDYSHLPVSLVTISSSSDLERLQSNPDVVSVMADGIVRTMAMSGLDMVGQPAVQAKGYTGSGTVVVIDTGVDYTRPAFGPCTAPGVPADTCKVVYMQDFADSDGVPDDGRYHGTNVAGIILNVAPGTKIIGLDVFNRGGTADYSTIVAAVDWVLANKAAYNITVMNLSLGGELYAGACDTHVLSAALNAAYTAGVLAAVAAGNNGSPTMLSVPGCASKVVSVGAVYPDKVAGPLMWSMCTDQNVAADTVTCFSNSAAGLTLLAPGYNIEAAGIVLSGTSQATPFVAGSLAVLKHKFSSLQPAQLVAQLVASGIQVLDGRNSLDKPRLNLMAAVGVTSCLPSATPATITAPREGGSFTFQVNTTATDCSWNIPTLQADWLRVVPDQLTGTGPGTVTVQVDATTSYTARTAKLTVVAADGTASLVVSQAAAGSPEAGPGAPKLGRLQGVSGRRAVELRWASAAGAQSAVSSYKVVYTSHTTAAPRARCTTGSPVAVRPSSTGSTYRLRVSGLSPGTRYNFRVCAVDAAGNIALGAVWRATTYN